MARHLRKALVIAISVGTVAWLIALFAPGHSPTPVTPAVGSPDIPVSLAPPEPEMTSIEIAEQVEPIDETSGDTALSPDEIKARLMASPIIRERIIEADRLEVATQRFSAAVDETEIDVEDMNRSVVDLFATARLEPVLAEGGMIEGLEILDLDSGSPFLEAGLRPGDQITHLNGVNLYDPAELPGLLVRLEREVSLCVRRDARELCRTLSLD